MYRQHFSSIAVVAGNWLLKECGKVKAAGAQPLCTGIQVITVSDKSGGTIVPLRNN